MKRIREESGQALVVSALFLTVLLGGVAMVLDVGSWFREQRDAQATADAAALAAAQALPRLPGQAHALATEYVGKNGGGTATVTFDARDISNDTVRVQIRRTAPGIFSRLFSIDSVQIGATAAALAAVPSGVRNAAPIAVDERHPLLSGPGCPCFQEETELDLLKVGPGAFRLINIDSSHGGVGPQILADWIRRGFEGLMPIDWYYSDPGTRFNASEIDQALTDRLGAVLLFPVYREVRSQGAGFEYHVVGWVGFRIERFEIQGSKKNKLYGTFETITWDGIQGDVGSGNPDFGVRTIALVE